MLRDALDRLLQQRPIPAKQILAEMAAASLVASKEDFSAVVEIARLDDVFDEILAYPAMALSPAWGSRGIDLLCDIATNGPHRSGALSILSVVSLGRVPTREDVHFLDESWDELKKYKLLEEIPAEALRRTREVILDHLTNPHRKSQLLYNIASQALFDRDNTTQAERLDFLMDMLVDGHLVLNKTILSQFEDLLSQGPLHEEDLHQFLVRHPVLLDPFVTELRSKHELGDDFITDFVVRRTNNEYVVVEIENSTDKLFTEGGAFTRDLMTAVAQVRDFHAWIADNIAYAQTKLPGIRHPDGLVVIGRRRDLSPQMEKRLSEENFSRRGHIKIVTYDDLLQQGMSVYRNALERPVVFRSKDKKSI